MRDGGADIASSSPALLRRTQWNRSSTLRGTVPTSTLPRRNSAADACTNPAMYGYAALGWLPALRTWYVQVRLFGWPSIEACRQAMEFDQHRVWNLSGPKREHAAV